MDNLTEVQEIIARLELYHYTRTAPEDLILLKWWMEMVESGDLQLAFPLTTQPLGAFLSMFQSKCILITSGSPIWYAFWFEPAFNSRAAWVGNWCSPSKRGTRTQFDATWAMFSYVLAAFPNILAMTKQESLIDEMTKIGYSVLGKFPKMFDNINDAWVLAMTAESFAASKLGSIRSK